MSVHVTDVTWIDSVYIDLTLILGPDNEMVQTTGPDGRDNGNWWIMTNAAYSIMADYCYLTVMAKDHHGNWNNGTRIPLTVRRRGDMTGDGSGMNDFDNMVDMADYSRIAQHTVGLLPETDGLVGEIVPADSMNGIDMEDALYIAMYTVFGPPGGSYPAP